MKKIVSLLLVMVLCLCTAIPVFAAGAGTIEVGSVTAKVGSTVEVPISIANNPGINYLKLKVSYDSTVLTMVSEPVPTSLITGSFTPGEKLTNNPYSMVWVGTGNSTGNGTIVTLKFKVSETAPLASTTVSVAVDECYNSADNSVPLSTKSGTVTVKEAGSSIEEASFQLSSNITANFYVDLATAHEGAKMRFTMNGEETLVDGVESGRNGLLLYQFEGISPQSMGDTIKAELVLNGEVLDKVDNYSVRAYCDMLFGYSAGDLGLTQAKFEASKTMMADLLEYGAMSQLYRNYKTDSLVNEGITGKSTFTELEAALWDKELGATNKAGTEFTGANVWFDNEIQLCFKFTAPGCTESNFCVKVEDTDTGKSKEYPLSSFQVISAEDSHYYIMSEPVPVSHFGHYFTITLNSGTVDRKGNRVLTPIQVLDYYGVNAYIFAKQNDCGANGELTNMANLARAAYCYGDSAAKYDSI